MRDRACRIVLQFAGRLTTLISLAYLAACSGKTEWNEEVRLQSGEIIVVRRTAILKENFIPGGGGGSLNEGMTVEVVRPMKPNNPAIWNARFVPVLFDRDSASGEWSMVATFFHCSSWNELGRPKLPYTEYRFRSGHWVQQPLSPQWVGRATNMFTGMRPGKTKDWTAEEKESRLNDTTIAPQYRLITDKWEHGC